MRSKNLWFGAFVLLGLISIAVFAPFIATQHHFHTDITRELLPPSGEAYFGTDQEGIDIFSQLVYGTRISLGVSFAVTFISAIIGLFLGGISGYFGNWTDAVVMRITDTVFAFPGLLLAITLAAVMGPSLINVVIALSITGWAGYARLIRGEVLVLREKEYIDAAKAIGASVPRIMLRHLFPNLIPILMVQMSFGMAGVVISEASLSFLGIGAPPGTPSWGALLSQGKDVLLEGPHVATFPGIFIMLVVLGFNFLGDGLRDVLDPRQVDR